MIAQPDHARSSLAHGRWRETLARVAWHAHPARPGPEYASLLESQWWTSDRIAELQLSELRRLMATAKRIAFYDERFRAARVAPGDIRTMADISHVPVLERHDLERLGIAGLRSPGSWGVRATSSGSLGKRVEFLWPLEQMRWLDAGEERARAWLGSELGTWRLEVRCRPVGMAQALGAALLNATAVHAPSIVDSGVAQRLLRELEHRRPSMIWGVSNALYVVAVALLDEGRTAPAGVCWSGGNLLLPHYRRAMEQAFQCPVYERYATMETGLVAHECPEGRSLHVPAEGILAEIVRADGSPAAPGEIGDVLVTCLRNHATPLIRYRVGDRAMAPDHNHCSCGRGLPVFGSVAGRTHDFLRTRSGELVGPREVVDVVLSVAESVVDMQVIQDAQGKLNVLVIQRDSAHTESDRERIAGFLDRLIQPPEQTRVERVAQIALTPGGKLRTIMSLADS
ncbi:MAG: phenylacetate--CoA ligase family protein [Anaerolineae bacterium]|nr:phenylacetate--CoA ligase family protein [Gemmatimonadaceae bacterium]